MGIKSTMVIPSVVAVAGEGGGGGGGTVDQTYDPTSTNAQSGTAVAEAVAPALKNTATGTNSLTLLGTATTSEYSVNIGHNSQAKSSNSISVGTSSQANGGIAIGIQNSANAYATIAIGNFSNCSQQKAISIGYSATCSSQEAIQLGTGTNSTAKTLQVFEWPLLDGTTGKIPADRLGTGFDATKTQVLKNINGTLTWVDE